MKKIISLAIIACFLVLGTSAYAITKINIPKEISKESKECISCHKESSVNIYQQWGYSKHFRANIGCYECHEAQKGESDAFEHEGRRVRHAASMQAPDYTQWHGNYDLARNWYGSYVPELKEVIDMGKLSNNDEAKKLAGELEKMLAEVMNDENHKWSSGKEDPAAKAERAKRRQEFLERYK